MAMAASSFEGDEHAVLFGYLGAAAAMVFSCTHRRHQLGEEAARGRAEAGGPPWPRGAAAARGMTHRHHPHHHHHPALLLAQAWARRTARRSQAWALRRWA